MSWTPGFNGNSDILNYTVEISTDNQTFTEARCQGLSSGGCVVSSSFTSASLVDLHPGRTYYIRMFATNKVGVSAVSSVITTTTDEEGKKIVKYHCSAASKVQAKFKISHVACYGHFSALIQFFKRSWIAVHVHICPSRKM